jgi:hypothetical protein
MSERLGAVSVSDFVVHSVQAAARAVVHEHATLRLNRQQSKMLVQMLLEPPEPNAALQEAGEGRGPCRVVQCGTWPARSGRKTRYAGAEGARMVEAQQELRVGDRKLCCLRAS